MPSIFTTVNTIHANQTNVIIPLLKQILTGVNTVTSTLDDLKAADAAIQAAVAQAVTLITSLHTSPGSVSDADVEKVVTDLNAAATALGGAMPAP